MKPRGVHLVGSVPLATSEDVFRTVASVLGDRVVRIPDGETGTRSDWIGWQMPVLFRNPAIEKLPPDPKEYRPAPFAKLREGVDASNVEFRPLGYADAARDSYAIFARLKREGTVPKRARFMVAFPTPLAPIHAFVWPGSRKAIEPSYERAILAELADVVAAIPHEELAIQWDCPIEMGMMEGRNPTFFDGGIPAMFDRLQRIGERVPEGVELGYHLCYGDFGHKHFMQPVDAGKCVEVANELSKRVRRRIDWIHFPVPRDRGDDAYLAPLKDLTLRPETRLYVGLVHLTDGVEGTRKRIATASKFVDDYGVATECGFGRRPPETIPALLKEHAEVADPV